MVNLTRAVSGEPGEFLGRDIGHDFGNTLRNPACCWASCGFVLPLQLAIENPRHELFG
jgi:hypothetical protein